MERGGGRRRNETTLREHDAALSLIEDLDERWFQENVVAWSSSSSSSCSSSSASGSGTRPLQKKQSQDESSSSPPPPLHGAVVVVDRSPATISPFRSIEMVQPLLVAAAAAATATTTASSSSSSSSPSSSGLRVAAILGPREKSQLLRTSRLGERRRLSDGDCIPRRGGGGGGGGGGGPMFASAGERKVKLLDAKLRCEEEEKEVLRIEFHQHLDVKQETTAPSLVDDTTVFPNRHHVLHSAVGETGNALPAAALPLPTGRLTDVREDGELENDIFAKSQQIPGNMPSSRLKTAVSSVDQLRVPLAESNTECQAQAQARAQRKPRRRMKGTRSLTELEYDELRGWSDLGFKVSKDDLTPEVVSMLPGLKILGSEDGLQPLRISSPRVRVYSPKHGMWIPRRPESPVLNLHTPAAIGEGGVDMKSQLKFWARAVASTVRIEC